MSFEHTKEFIKYKYRSADLEIEKLDYDFIANYEFWMKAVRKCSHNTTMKYLSNFKKISYTGLAYADVFKLKRAEIIDGSDGEKWMVIKRQKTDSPSRIPLLPQALSIISAYYEHPQCIAQDRLLPVLSNQKMNSYLKEISDLCGIRKQITFHLARHTFATTVTLTNGVPIQSVSKMLGHRYIKTTRLYARIVDYKIRDDMRRLKELLGTS